MGEKDRKSADRKERYIAALMNGTTVNVVAKSFTEVAAMIGEDEIWQITKLYFEEEGEP